METVPNRCFVLRLWDQWREVFSSLTAFPDDRSSLKTVSPIELMNNTAFQSLFTGGIVFVEPLFSRQFALCSKLFQDLRA